MLEDPSWFTGQQGFNDAWRDSQLRGLQKYEEQAVKRLCQTFNEPWINLAVRHRETKGQHVLRLRTFNETGLCPVQFFVSKLLALHRLEVGDVFRDFTRSVLGRTFLENSAEFAADTTTCMIFSWPKVDRFMCMHTGTLASTRGKYKPTRKNHTDAAIVARLKRPKQAPLRVVIERLDRYLPTLL